MPTLASVLATKSGSVRMTLREPSQLFRWNAQICVTEGVGIHEVPPGVGHADRGAGLVRHPDALRIVKQQPYLDVVVLEV